MKDIIATIILTAITYVICILIQSNTTNVLVENILNSVPLMIPVFSLWWNNPRVLLRTSFWKNRDITYKIIIRIDTDIEDDSSLDKLVELFQGECSVRVFDSQQGEYLYKKTLVVDRAVFELTYNYEASMLLIETEYDTTTKRFLKRATKIYEVLQTGTRQMNVKDQFTQIEIIFRDERDKACNPFLQKLFEGFPNFTATIRYQGAHDSDIRICNESIIFKTYNLENIKEDLVKELYFYSFK